jgi:N-acetylglucosaminyldiphosphoundecaprenol N-acetyl-beta-D-mannosaminyltransferase
MLKEYFEHLYTGSQEAFFKKASKALDHEEKMFVVTANPETMMIGEQNPEFNAVLCKPDTIIVPDGIGVVRAADSLGMETNGRVTGVELAEHLIRHAGKTGKSIFLYGAKEEVITTLVERIKQDYPIAVIAGYRNGYGQNDDEVFEEIHRLKPDIILVALGIPRQELLIDRWLDRFDKGIFVGVGGSFDVLSGTKKRAPKFFVRFNLEWLYRIVKEPKRFGRFYRSNVRFLLEVRKMRRMEK